MSNAARRDAPPGNWARNHGSRGLGAGTYRPYIENRIRADNTTLSRLPACPTASQHESQLVVSDRPSSLPGTIQGCSDDQPNDPSPGNRKPLFAIRPDVRRDRTGHASRAAIDPARAGVHLHRSRHARARHRPQYRDFLRRLRRTLASAALSQSRSLDHRLVSAADRDGREDVLDVAARDLRGAATARHHARSSRGLCLHRRAVHRPRRAAAVARARRESEFLRHAGRESRARPRVPL